MAKPKRVTIFAGHYGSGKTNIAVNYAIRIKQNGYPVKIGDMDIVNPYFRTKDSAKELEEAGIQLISPAFANSNVDLPALPQQLYALVWDKSYYAVLDVGGDDRGAYALGRYADFIKEENDYEMVFVANFFRPLTLGVDSAIEVMREIESACKIKFTGIVNNSNLGNLTTASDVESTFEKARELCEKTGLPLLFTSVTEEVSKNLNADDTFAMTLQKKYFDIKEI
jgi:hypothetical protein